MAMKRLILDTLARTGIIAVTVMVMAIASANAQPPPTPPAGPIGRSPVAGTSSTSSTAIAQTLSIPWSRPRSRSPSRPSVKTRQLPDSVRFVTVTLNEPPKEIVLHPTADGRSRARSFLILLDNATGRGYEAVVDLCQTSRDPIRRAAGRGPAADHARRVRRVRRGGPAVAGLPRGVQEARDRGPEPGDDRRLVGGPLRQRTAGGPGQAALSRTVLGPLRAQR